MTIFGRTAPTISARWARFMSTLTVTMVAP
jgi:hypothetical protein